MKKDTLTTFPKQYTPSSQQTKILSKINRFLNGDKKFAIVSAPTGSGKSFVSKAICNTVNNCSEPYRNLAMTYDLFRKDYHGNLQNQEIVDQEPPHGSFILTITKNLQDQYIKFFQDIIVYKGKANYDCEIDPTFDVQTAPCVFTHNLRDDCWEKDICPYYQARNNALSSKIAVLNYRKFLTISPEFKKKQVLICDEASELEEELVSTFSITVNYQDLERHGITHTKLRTDVYKKVRQWLNTLLIEVAEEKEELSAHQKRIKRSQREINKLKFLVNFYENLALVEWNWNNCEYVIDKNAQQVTFMPLRVDKLSHHIFNHGQKVILMSATFLDIDQYCKDMGINKRDCEVIDVDSTFDPEKSPIIVSDKYKINYKTKHKVLPKLVPLINAILEHHGKEKGVIHTHSQDIADFISDKVKSSRLLFRKDGTTNEDILLEHEMLESPSVLVSPSLRFGVDLKDDLSRFQIIIKVPYPPLSNKRIARIFKEDKQWYMNKTLSTLVQTCGRSTRSKGDHSVTYILDAAVIKLLENNVNKLPEHFIKRIH